MRHRVQVKKCAFYVLRPFRLPFPKNQMQELSSADAHTRILACQQHKRPPQAFNSNFNLFHIKFGVRTLKTI